VTREQAAKIVANLALDLRCDSEGDSEGDSEASDILARAAIALRRAPRPSEAPRESKCPACAQGYYTAHDSSWPGCSGARPSGAPAPGPKEGG
jgi:hypothetical protein